MTELYEITREAEKDIQAIWSYIGENNILAADRVEAEIFSAFELLAENPYIGHAHQHIPLPNIRIWNVYSYQIIYLPESQPLKIVRIMSSYRDLSKITSQLSKHMVKI